jgi:hypothetical protein
LRFFNPKLNICRDCPPTSMMRGFCHLETTE